MKEEGVTRESMRALRSTAGVTGTSAPKNRTVRLGK